MSIIESPWSSDEDAALRNAYAVYGEDWDEVAKMVVGRSAAKCKERYRHYIGPDVNKGNWTQEEDNLLLELQKQWGNEWASMARVPKLVGRTANDIRTRVNTLNRERNRR